MLDTLESLTREQAADVLAAATHALSPSPEVVKSTSTSVQPELLQQLLEDIRRHLHLQAHDDSPRAQSKIFAFLSKNISDHFLSHNMPEIKRRLGQRGDLAPNDYTIVFPEEVEEACAEFGIRKKLVMEALLHPHQVEHLLPEKVEAGAPAVSLYSRRIGTPQTKDFHRLLVETIRSGDQQEVATAFLVYDREVSVAFDASPLETLRAFVRVYGLRFSIGPVEGQEFVLYEARPLPVEKFDVKHLVRVEAPNDERFFTFGIFRQSPLGALEVVAAYTVNLDKYAADLERHGVRITWKRDQWSPRVALVRYG